MSLEGAVSLYKSSTWKSQKDRAQAEEEIWVLALKEGVKGDHIRRVWIYNTLGVKTSESEDRQTLLNAGDDVEKAWAMIDEGKLSLGSAHDLLTIAKKRAMLTQRAVKEEFEGMLELALEKGICKAAHIRLSDREEMLSSAKVKSAEVDLDAPWRSIKMVLLESLGLKEVENELRRAKIQEDFEREVKSAYDLARSRITREKQIKTMPVISKTAKKEAVQDACRVLGIDYPRAGEKPDMVAAKKAWRSLVRAYHPDTSGTNDTRDRYERVMKAYSTLEEI